MLVGDPAEFAIESCVSIAYEELGALALGFFVIHLGGRCYGVREPDATWLACSFGEVEDRLGRRGSQCFPGASFPDAGKIADAYRYAIYAPDAEAEQFLQICPSELADFSMDLAWAPDGDEAFDDGSYVLHFDLGDRVRLIGFRIMEEGYRHDPSTLRDVWLEADKFYNILQTWHDSFEAEWKVAPKLFKAHGPDERKEQHWAEIDRLAKMSQSIRQVSKRATD